MPIYPYRCLNCGLEIDLIRNMNSEMDVSCNVCGDPMRRQPTFPAMIKIKGNGGYPSRRKFVSGSAPYTTRDTKPWLKPNEHMLNSREPRQ